MAETAGYDGRVVAGCDGSPASVVAVTWAADRARARGLPLTLLCATGGAGPASDAAASLGTTEAALRDALIRGIDAIADQIRGTHPGLEVEVRISDDRPAHALVSASESAQLLVVGTRGLGRVAGALLGSVAEQVVTHAKGTVIVVPHEFTASTGPTGPGRPVVVGLDDSETAARAVRFAFEEARTEERQVLVVHVLEFGDLWTLRPLDVIAEEDPLDRHAVELESMVDRWRSQNPDVVVHSRLSQGPSATSALLDASESASLLVVGSRGRGGFAGLLLGSTSRRVLRSARCPVAVVR